MQFSTLRLAALPLLALLVLAAPASAQSYRATLTGPNERPTPNASPATGTMGATLTGTTLVVTGTFSGLTGNYAASHIHTGGAAATGPVIFALAPTVATDQRGGTFAAAANTFTLTPAQVTALQSDGLYVNIHSATFGGGEIRGQLVAGITVAAARASGAGTTVTVTATVSRTKSVFTQLQDDTAGLTVRQTTGAFFDAVAAGTIVPGTRVTITGLLSEFRGLIQINGVDLTSFTVDGQGAAPLAQTVTLAQIAAGGEQYESELLRVANVTITGPSPFAPATNYAITDASSSTNAVALRIIGANDTDVDGRPVPTPTANVTGVLGQFDTAVPAVAGYQIQPILATDVTQGGTASAETPAGRLTLDVANPLRGAAVVRFSTETAQDVRLALYDALGREVAVVAQGTAAGAQSATLNTAGLAAGVYVLRLTAGAGVLTQTVTVVR